MNEGAPGLLLVHGAWLGPWLWDLLEPQLQNRGMRYATVALPSCGKDPATLGSLADDARAIAEGAAAFDGDVVVVAHSYGGIPTTQATFGSNVRRLVYLCAFMPDMGRSLVSYLPPGDFPPFVHLRGDGSSDFVDALIPSLLCSDCDEETTAMVRTQIRLHSDQVIATPVDSVAWQTIPSTYIVASADRVIPPGLQRMYALQATDRQELPTDHMPMLSKLELLANTLAAIVASEQSALLPAS